MNTQKMEDMIVLLKKAQQKEGTYDEFQTMINYLNTEASKSYAKLNGKQNLQKAIKAMLSKSDMRPVLRQPFTNDNGYTYVTDSYQALQIKDTTGIRIEENTAVKNGVNAPQMSKLFERNNTDTIEELPDMGTIEKYIKSAKALYKSKGFAVYKLQNGTLVNAQFLKNGILATGTKQVYYENATQTKPVWMWDDSENVTALLLPIHPKTLEGVPFDENGFTILHY